MSLDSPISAKGHCLDAVAHAGNPLWRRCIAHSSLEQGSTSWVNAGSQASAKFPAMTSANCDS
ncbi:MAG: hypothetical protein F6K65_16345 [Moorea sp. SIO3C2]|nr:hypothetical protein [Moorena sp. SIO3C2]